MTHHEPERRIDDQNLGLTCIIYGQAPVQADGRIKEARFYFRSRHSAWTFTVSVSHDIDASCLTPPIDADGFFQCDEFRGYELSGDYGTDHDASYMRYEVAEQLIRNCADRYLKATSEAS